MTSEPAGKHSAIVSVINYFTYLAIPCAALLLVIYTQFTRSTEALVVSQHESHQAMAIKLQALASVQASLRLYALALQKDEAPLMEGALMEVELALVTLDGLPDERSDTDSRHLLMSVERYRELLDRAAERMAKGLFQEESTNLVAKRLAEGLRSSLQLSAFSDQRDADVLYASLTEKISLYYQAFVFVSWSLVTLLLLMWWRQRVQLRTEARLRGVALEANAAVKSRSEFMAVMSHEIRTPLNGVLGMADLLLQTNLSAAQKTYTDTIVTSGDSLLTVINDILDLSKIEAGKVELDSVPFALGACIKNNIQLVGVSKSDDVSLSFVIDANVPELVCADKNRLSQIIVNLLGNALKFTPAGYVKLQVYMDEDQGGVLCFRVWDSGIGIRQEVLPHIFDSFTQADSTITRDFGGTGLGLSITRLLVTLMGGEISVRSEVGRGSCFEFSIRVEQVDQYVESSDIVEQQIVTVAKRENINILVAEDNVVNQKVVSKMLKNLNYKHEVVANGVEAVSKSDRVEFDLILMDLQMPELSGLEAAERILSASLKDGDNKAGPIIVALTANVLEEDRVKCESVGMSGFLTKPIKQRELEACLNRLLGGVAVGGEASVLPAISRQDQVDVG
ncbi:hypothetical protein A9Q99_07745 [Gammaproteobacteria bacterium 45_16_T64]|nr:hypothetical protein A9Q99_07745 [Gammaproteobacteria bacterium 45_16_T64]